MEAADYEVLSVREQLFHERVRECIVSTGLGQERYLGPSGGEARVSREREKFGSECDHPGSERRQVLRGLGASDGWPRCDRKTRARAGKPLDRISWGAAR